MRHTHRVHEIARVVVSDQPMADYLLRRTPSHANPTLPVSQPAVSQQPTPKQAKPKTPLVSEADTNGGILGSHGVLAFDLDVIVVEAYLVGMAEKLAGHETSCRCRARKFTAREIIMGRTALAFRDQVGAMQS